MQTISVLTTQNVSIQYPVATVGDRIPAYLPDRLILIAYAIVAIAALVSTDIGRDVWWLGAILVAIPWLFYHLAFEIFMNGQSPGKRVMNIQVVRLDGTQPSIGDYVLRWVFSLIDFYFMSGRWLLSLLQREERSTIARCCCRHICGETDWSV